MYTTPQAGGIFNCIVAWWDLQPTDGAAWLSAMPNGQGDQAQGKAQVERSLSSSQRASGQRIFFQGYERALQMGEKVLVRLYIL